MFNLFISANESSWEGEPFIIEAERCIREYTRKEIIKSLGQFKPKQIEKVRSFPCIFAYESPCEKDPKFGLIKEVLKRRDQVKIEYEIIEIDNFLTHEMLSEIEFELDIYRLELRRTHWAVKDVNLPKELAVKGIKLPNWTTKAKQPANISNHIFDVSLSFPGEIRQYVKSIVAELEAILGPDKYFYDDNYKAQLARPSLDELLQDIYRNRSKLVVVFLSEKYGQKEWCGLEFRAIKEIIMEKQHEKVMFVKMDEGEVKGVFKTDGYIDGNKHTPREIALLIEERLMII